MKRQLKEWEKVLVNQLSDKGLTSKKYKELLQYNSNKTKQNKNPQVPWLKYRLKIYIDIFPKKIHKEKML